MELALKYKALRRNFVWLSKRTTDLRRLESSLDELKVLTARLERMTAERSLVHQIETQLSRLEEAVSAKLDQRPFELLSQKVEQLSHLISDTDAIEDEDVRERIKNGFEVLKMTDKPFVVELLNDLKESKSQLGQDIFVLTETCRKRGGFFVDFGATDGLDLSNSWLLEKRFGWTGIVCEPGRSWHPALRSNRNCAIETRCIWTKSGEFLSFHETPMRELSTLELFRDSDFHAEARAGAQVYSVETISLLDMLEHFDAPTHIDYLSIDTEGSEYDVLKAFDFNKYRIGLITCEHNYTPAREKIFELLTANGFVRKFENLSRWDDWYIQSDN